tara:strand:- start:198 stop:413 length:216 start_codon:yes stop_codon:yes gene_type:complete
MSNKICYYICRVIKVVPDSINFFEEEEEYGYGLPYKDILAEVEQHYKNGADAVVLEMITEDEFNDRLPKPY